LDIDHNQPAPDRAQESFRHVLSCPAFYRFGFLLARRIPPSILYRVADCIGDASRRRYPERERNVLNNLEGAFRQRSPREIAEIARRLFRNYARTLVDYGRYRGIPLGKIEGEIPSLEGREYVDAVIRSGEGIILVTGHVGNWELGGLYFAFRGKKVNVVTLPDDVAQIDAIRERYRERHEIRTIVLDGSPFATLEMAAALRRGEMVAMLVDRWEGEGVRADFFGRQLLLPRGPFALSRATGAKILPAFVVREEGSRAYKGILEKPFAVQGRDDEPYARTLAMTLARIITRYPDQWYNFEPLST